MPLIRTKYDKSRSHKLQIVILMEESIALYLNLHSLAMGTSRTQTIRSLIEQWYAYTSADITEEMLIDKIMARAEQQWEVLQQHARTKSQYENYDDFLDQLERELKNKDPKIDRGIVKTIIRRLDEKNKDR